MGPLSLFLLLSLAVLTPAVCPVATCTTLGYNACASFTGSDLSLNVQNCTQGLHCSAFKTYHWARLRMDAGDVEGTLWCSQDGYEPPEVISAATKVTCGQRDKKQTLKDGAYPKQCASSMDCELLNGEYSNCECGMDGATYCVAEWGSSIMDGFWNACNNSTNLIDASSYQYWSEYRKLYLLDSTKPVCALSLFGEFQFLSNAAASWLYLGMVTLLS